MQCVAQCRIQDMVGESRRLEAEALLALLRGLIATVHASLPWHERDFRRRRGRSADFSVLGGDSARGVGDNDDAASGGIGDDQFWSEA